MDFTFSDENKHWQEKARTFAQERVAPIARAMDEEGSMPKELIKEMGNLGLLGSTLSKRYGGSEMSNLSQTLVYEELGRACSSVRGFVTVHSSLVMQCINHWGNEEQKKKYLPSLAKGERIGCYALTEPEAGSDAASIRSEATNRGDGYEVNGEKIWITNANVAHLAIVFARTPELKTEKSHQQITAFLIDTSLDGFIREPMPGKELGHRASDHARILLKNVRVGADCILGGLGEGFKVAMQALDFGRLGVAAGALGVHQACLDASLAFVRSRRQFKQRIGDFEMVQSDIAMMKVSLEASRGLVYRAACQKDEGKPSKLETSIAKLYATEAALKAASDAVLLHGGRGYSNEYPVERYYRDIKGLQIYEGTSHIQKLVIAREIIGKE